MNEDLKYFEKKYGKGSIQYRLLADAIAIYKMERAKQLFHS